MNRASEQGTFTDYLQKGIEARERHDFDEAVRQFDVASQISPNDALPLIGLSLIYQDQNRAEDAIAVLRRAAAIDGRRADIFKALGLEYQKTKRPELAIEAFNKALELELFVGRRIEILSLLGELYLRIDNYSEAINVFGKASQMGDGDKRPKLLYSLADAYFRNKQYDQARETLEALVKLQPQEDALSLLGSTYQRLGRHVDAERMFREAIKLNPANGRHYLDRGLSRYLQGKRDKANTDFHKAASINRADPVPRFLIGVALLQEGDLDGALSSLKEALKLDCEDEEYIFATAFAYFLKNNSAESQELIQRALSKGSTDARFHELLGRVRSQQGDFLGAIDAMQQAISINPKNPAFAIGLASIYADMGQEGKAIDLANQTTDFSNAGSEAYYHYGNLLLRLRRYGDAEIQFLRALEFDDAEHQQIYCALGETCISLRKMDQALEYLFKAIEIAPDYAPAHFYVGVAWYRKNEYVKAIRSLKTSIRHSPASAAPYRLLSLVYYHQNEFELAISAVEKAIEEDPQNQHLYIQLGDIEVASRRLEDAKKAYMRGQELSVSPGSLVGLARVSEAEQRYEEAEDYCLKALQLQADYYQAYVCLAFIHHHQQHLSEAEVHARRAVELAPTAQNYSILGIILKDLNRYEECLDVEKRAFELEPDKPLFNNNLGFALLLLNRVEEAMVRFRAALEGKSQMPRAALNLGLCLFLTGAVYDGKEQYRKALKLTGMTREEVSDHLEDLTLLRKLYPISTANIDQAERIIKQNRRR